MWCDAVETAACLSTENMALEQYLGASVRPESAALGNTGGFDVDDRPDHGRFIRLEPYLEQRGTQAAGRNRSFLANEFHVSSLS